MRVAVLGLGSMGMGAARNLARTPGLVVTGVDPRVAARDAFVAQTGDPGGLARARGCDLDAGQQAVLVLVVNAAQADAALFGPEGAAARLAPGAVCILSSTMSPAEARGLAAKAAALGLLYLDAPVSGGVAGAASGQMIVMASGAQAAFDAAAPILAAISRRVFDLGRAPGLGTTMKIVHQLLAGVHIAAAAEAMALGVQAGIAAETLYEVVTSAAGNSWMFQNRMQHVLDGDDRPASAVDIFVKDLGLVTDLARAEALPVPLAAQAQQLFIAASAMGQGRRDDAFVIRVWQALAGFALPQAAHKDG